MMKIYFFILLVILPWTHYSQPNTDVFLFDVNIQDERLELSNFRNISENNGYNNQPSFMDNNTILYAGTRNGQTDIVQYSIDDASKKWISDTEGSEFSPLKIPNQNTVAAIRLEKDGTQKLYGFDLNSNEFGLLVDDMVIGYQLWIDANTLISAVLMENRLDLFQSNLILDRHEKLVENVGRSLHIIPNIQMISYISKENDKVWTIKSLDLTTEVSKTIIQTLDGIEDMCWTPYGSILMAKNGIIYEFYPKKDDNWYLVAKLEDYGITNITRMAINPDGKKLAVVGELANKKLEPKLENIQWIAGAWKGEAFGGQTEEIWSEPSGGSMMATFKLIVDGKVQFYEIEIIREIENSLVLQLKHFDEDLKGWETKDETVDFKLKEITANKVIFEGMTFEKISDNEMNVHVDIENDKGIVETVIFNYKK